MTPFDPSSLVFLLLGKDNQWFPLIILAGLLFQKWNTICSLYEQLHMYGKAQYTITGKFYVNKENAYKYGSLSKSMYGILMDIHRVVDCTIISKTNIASLALPSTNVLPDTVMIPVNGVIMKINDTLSVKMDVTHTNSSINSYENGNNHPQNKEIEDVDVKMTLISSKSFDDLMKYIQGVTDTYKKLVDEKTKQVPVIIKPTFGLSGSTCDYPTTIPFKSTKTFDNLFFDERTELLHRLNMLKKSETYARLGLPQSLGLLFYGEPGTGKTSTIKAIANYMNMSIIIVPMNQIKTRKQLESIFYGEQINEYVPYDKRIYVFEEIDCNGWDKIVMDRRLVKNNEQQDQKADEKENNLKQIAAILDDRKSDPLGIVKRNSDDALTLGAFLDVLDGIVEVPGRIVIMTTNHRDILDPALTRPGRIDLEIEFKKLRGTHIAEIYKQWYGHSLRQDQIDALPNFKYTQADISQKLFAYETDSDKFIRNICEC